MLCVFNNKWIGGGGGGGDDEFYYSLDGRAVAGRLQNRRHRQPDTFNTRA